MPELTYAQIAALSYEIDDTTALLIAGRQTLVGLRSTREDATSVIVLLSAGAEKLLKLTLGLIALDDTGSWPSRSKMRDWGHNIEAMSISSRERIRERIALSNVPAYIDLLLTKAGEDPVLPAFLHLLSRYAMAGRFHNLDELGGATDLQAPARELWDEMENSLVLPDAGLLARLVNPIAYPGARRELNELLDVSLQGWLELHFRAWQHGISGPHARSWSGALSDVAAESVAG